MRTLKRFGLILLALNFLTYITFRTTALFISVIVLGALILLTSFIERRMRAKSQPVKKKGRSKKRKR
ncbi:MAG: hypothetical protein ACOX7U_00625 [Desulfitobacteriia bacterium]|jgi:hypothetical protein